MRNNFNTSAFSELAFEIRDDPKEGWFSFAGISRYTPNRGLVAHIGPALLGSLKSARKFSFLLDSAVASGGLEATYDPRLSPMDLALTGLGACTMKTLIGGGSARSVIFEGAELAVSFSGPQPGGVDQVQDLDASVECKFQVNANASDEVLVELLGQVQEYSPNHRTFTDKMPLCADFRETRIWPVDGKQEAPTTHSGSRDTSGRRVLWVTGTQFESWSLDTEGDAVKLTVDSPKQLTGADWGPNAQEYLLMGLASDIASELSLTTIRELGRELAWEVKASGSIDAAGMLDTGESLVGLQDTACSISILEPTDPVNQTTLDDIVQKSIRSSIVRSLITDPTVVNVSLVAGESVSRRIGRQAS